VLARETHEFLTALAGRTPVDEPLWLEALTHGSTGAARDYQRLEFLGDRVLGMVIAEWLYKLEDGNEGRLSQRLNALVSRTTCAAVARSIGLGQHMHLGKQARDDGGQDSDNILGDVLGEVIGHKYPGLGIVTLILLILIIGILSAKDRDRLVEGDLSVIRPLLIPRLAVLHVKCESAECHEAVYLPIPDVRLYNPQLTHL
jgi:hypothetical protein